MKIGPLRVMARIEEGRTHYDDATAIDNRADPGNLASTNGSGESDVDSFFDSPVYRQLPAPLQEESKAHSHLCEYIFRLPVDDIGIPDYKPQLTKSMSTLQYRNLIYPVGEGIYIHLYPDLKDSRDFYITIEPSMVPSIFQLMELVDARLIDHVEDLKASSNELRAQVLLNCLDRICTTKGDFRRRHLLKVTEKEIEGLRYLLIRDKEGLGIVEPLINDPYIEDITCMCIVSTFGTADGELRSDN